MNLIKKVSIISFNLKTVQTAVLERIRVIGRLGKDGLSLNTHLTQFYKIMV